MKLSTAETELFYGLYRKLLFFVNQQAKVIGDLGSPDQLQHHDTSEVQRLRSLLCNQHALIDAYVAENPHRLVPDELAIVQKWTRMVTGDFHIFRFLKKYTVFISSGGVYGVLALQDDFDEMLHGVKPPVMVNAVLLPFKGKIIYDGSLAVYQITFGGGIRRRLSEEYMRAKNTGRIIETLEPGLVEHKLHKKKNGGAEKQMKKAVDELVSKATKLKGSSPVQTTAFSLFKASANLAQSAAHDPEDYLRLADFEKKVRRAHRKLLRLLNDLAEDF